MRSHREKPTEGQVQRPSTPSSWFIKGPKQGLFVQSSPDDRIPAMTDCSWSAHPTYEGLVRAIEEALVHE
jgi:hypothetical protein